jgi:hypothetical protein
MAFLLPILESALPMILGTAAAPLATKVGEKFSHAFTGKRQQEEDEGYGRYLKHMARQHGFHVDHPTNAGHGRAHTRVIKKINFHSRSQPYHHNSHHKGGNVGGNVGPSPTLVGRGIGDSSNDLSSINNGAQIPLSQVSSGPIP